MTTAIDGLDTSSITVEETSRMVSYTVDDPLANVLFIPGGLVNPHSYDYLVINLALNQYNVTVFKPFFDLAILTPNFASRYLDDSMPNYIVGHSLGGVVASMISSGNDLISKVVLLGSYPVKDISDKETLLITAEFDLGMDEQAFTDSLQYVGDNFTIVNIEGGNHAQFGWYGPQKGDGEALISTLEQQTQVIQLLLDFFQSE